MNSLLQRNPRAVRITAWILAGSVAYIWYQRDRKKAPADVFTADDANKWNRDVLDRTHTLSEAERAQRGKK
ncbi:hypothetical protein ABG067_005936 [Albugo candida]|uniref:Uncharacterized protein n=1 Tax=Albugo candida TaxID=65357 RepID=A0A024GGC5_9STRA|nr:unnamed protein product [Albugo candida]|eukprot:CCI45588.1 unnamed protein product [Albugo candida]